MPRVRRKGFERRSPEIPVSELSLEQLRAENAHLHCVMTGRAQSDEDAWYVLQRSGELSAEIRRRQHLPNQDQTTVTSIEEAKCPGE